MTLHPLHYRYTNLRRHLLGVGVAERHGRPDRLLQLERLLVAHLIERMVRLLRHAADGMEWDGMEWDGMEWNEAINE